MLGFVVPIRIDENQKHLYLEWLADALKLGIHVALIFDGAGVITVKEEIETLKLQFRNLLLTDHVDVGNPGEARNRGLEIIQSDWIAFIDSDDFVFYELYLDLAFSMKDSKKSVGVGNFVFSSDQSNKSSQITFRKNSLYARIKYPGLWRYIFSKERIGSTKFRKGLAGEDIAFLCDLGLRVGEIFVSQEVIYRYNKNVLGQLTGRTNANFELAALLKAMPKLYLSMNLQQSYSFLLRLQLNSQYLAFRIRSALSK